MKKLRFHIAGLIAIFAIVLCTLAANGAIEKHSTIKQHEGSTFHENIMDDWKESRKTNALSAFSLGFLSLILTVYWLVQARQLNIGPIEKVGSILVYLLLSVVFVFAWFVIAFEGAPVGQG